MNSILKPLLFIPAVCLLLLSCNNDDSTSLSLTKQDIALNVGLSDTLNVVVNYVGDQAKVPVNAIVSDSTIATARVLRNKDDVGISKSTFNCAIAISAKGPGTTSLVINAGTKKITRTITISQTMLILNQSLVQNYGLAIETSNSNVFIMEFFPETINLDRNADSFTGSGQFIHLEAFFSGKTTSVPAGTFCSNLDGSVNTFLPGDSYVDNGKSYMYGTYIETVENNHVSYTLVKSGQYTINIKGSTYYIEGDLTTETNEIVHFSYFGQIPVVDKTEKPTVVNPLFTKGDLFYAGDYYNMGLSDTFFAYLETSNVDIYSNKLDGEVLVLQINAYEFYTSYISSGTYNMLTQSAYENFAVNPFTLVPGNFHLSRNQVVTGGCWYYNTNSRKRLIAGNVEIGYDSNNYVIKYSLSDRIGSQITGSFNAKLKMSAPAVKVKSELSNKCNPVALPSLGKSQSKNFGRIHETQFRYMGMK